MNIPFDRIRAAVKQEVPPGFCLKCGTLYEDVQDEEIEKYCRACNSFNIYSTKEIIIMGRVE